MADINILDCRRETQYRGVFTPIVNPLLAFMGGGGWIGSMVCQGKAPSGPLAAAGATSIQSMRAARPRIQITGDALAKLTAWARETETHSLMLSSPVRGTASKETLSNRLSFRSPIVG